MIHPTSLPVWPAIIFLSISLIFPRVPTCLCADDPQFLNCSSKIQCGNLQNIGYPFWGSNRANYCGLGDEFELTCEDNIALLTQETLKYRLLSYDNSTKNFTVARDDYWGTLCPPTYVNSSQDPSPFAYTLDTVANNLTFYYGCKSSNFPTIIPVTSQFYCSADVSIGFFVTRNVRDISNFGNLDLTTVLNYSGECETSVVVPAYVSAIQAIESNPLNTTVEAALEGGFGWQWTDDNNACADCVASGGQCGREGSSNDFACYCSDGSDSSTCSGSEKKNGVSLGIGLAIAGAGITGILLGFWIFSWQQKKKRKRTAAAEAQAQSIVIKDITPPSSKEGLLPTSTTSYSRSTPSFMSTQTDIEKGSTYFGVQVFSYVELEEATQNFDPSRELGEGGFGTVYYGALQDGRVVAVKRLYENNFKRMEQFMNEVEILTRLRHNNLVTLYGCTSRRSRELLLVYEYIPNGTVADHVHGKKASSTLLPWDVRLNIAIESADALSYLHKSDVIHRDVKTNNILLDNSFRVKVADFGLSRLFPQDVTHVSTAPQGTPGYVDPEYYQCYQLTDKSDVYSFGVVLCELISSKPAVDTNRLRHDINLASMAISKIQNHALNELVDPSLGFDTDSGVRRMITLVAELAFRCLQHERETRPTMEEVLKCLLQIKNEEISTEKAEVVDIHSDDVGQTKSTPPPISPDSVVIDKWMSSSTPNSY